MALKVEIQKSENISLWKEYKDEEGNVLAEFKIRGQSYKPYRVALERAQNQVAHKGYDVPMARADDKLYHELLLEATACHLIEDWKGVVFIEDGQEVEQTYSAENATKLLNMGDIGVAIWGFVMSHAEKIQNEADQVKADILGKSQPSINGTAQTSGRRSTKRNNSKR
ncbi:hypothetical protein B9T31_08690 [Acinetobacter sp. ANC 4558]|uniref:hypothetical protein n=1 Tax=Acinetobacter sp. ANC 4558 TaxID=1977876 RepID=UPI000A32E3F5|nr:hypothetical protein [Acinetobacter sp. ANC 4558]OTG86107.1 hypothetical protein B9T31_08690 [Acinetobacter sp. ANC 4558]